MLFVSLTSAIAILLAAPSGVAATAAPVHGAAAEFASAITEHAGAGWRLRDVAVTEDDSATEIRLTYTSGKQGHALVLRWGAAPRRRVEFAQRPAAVPAEDRIYTFERELADAMADGPPTELDYGCSAHVLSTATVSVVIDDSAYYTVEQRARRGGGRVLAEALAAAIADGGELASVAETDLDGRDRLSLIVDGPDQRLQILAELDAAGAVSGVEVRAMPQAEPAGGIAGSEALGRALAGRRVARMALGRDPDGSPRRLDLVLDTGAALGVDLAAREPTDEDCGC